MRNPILGRILMYIGIWLGLFIVLCIVSIIKNWDALLAVLNNTFTATISVLIVAGLLVFLVVSLVRAPFR